MTLRALLPLLILAACGTDNGLSVASGTKTPIVPQSTGCRSDGEFDFTMKATALGPWEGKNARIVALEPANFGESPASQARVPVDVVAVVENGTVSVHCGGALKENLAYPSFALFVDVDGDGRCGIGDVGAAQQYYGWNSSYGEQGFSLPRETWSEEPSSPSDWMSGVHGQGPIGGATNSFCGDFFP